MVNQLTCTGLAPSGQCERRTSNVQRRTSNRRTAIAALSALDVRHWTLNVRRSHFLFLLWILVLLAAPAFAQDKPKVRPAPIPPKEEADYYKILTFTPPPDVRLEAGAIAVLPDGKTVACSTRRGDVYFVENAFTDNPADAKFRKWATGMHEVLGLAYNPRDQFLYAVQRGEVTKLKDTDGDGTCDVYETFCDDWGVSGDYHEYPIGSTSFDKDGNLFVVLCLTGSFTSDAPFRGWCLKITPEGKAIPYASGIRSPAGLAFNGDGELFYCDNQGPWNGTSSLKFIEEGAFEGHPAGNKWYSLAQNLGPAPETPQSNSRFHVEAARIKQYHPPAVLLPHQQVGQSASGIAFDVSGGKFGPFKGHAFVNDQNFSNLTRCSLEKVDGCYQGVAIPFRSGFASGNVPVVQAPDGSLFVGGTNRGWGSRGARPGALERVVWTGKTPFELLDMKVKADGFELTFTEPVDKASAAEASSYDMITYTYLYRADYGSPEVDSTKATVKSATVSDDGLKVKLAVDGMGIGHVHELTLPGIRSAQDAAKGLLHPIAWYTLWKIPK
jgi:hypothetical protein